MTENNDERLLEQFFQQARQQEIADDGFTERVTRSLPDSHLQQSRWWTLFCVGLGVVLFTIAGGWRLLSLLMVKMLITLPTTGQIAQLWLMMLLLTVLGIAEFFRRERILDLKTLF